MKCKYMLATNVLSAYFAITQEFYDDITEDLVDCMERKPGVKPGPERVTVLYNGVKVALSVKRHSGSGGRFFFTCKFPALEVRKARLNYVWEAGAPEPTRAASVVEWTDFRYFCAVSYTSTDHLFEEMQRVGKNYFKALDTWEKTFKIKKLKLQKEADHYNSCGNPV